MSYKAYARTNESGRHLSIADLANSAVNINDTKVDMFFQPIDWANTGYIVFGELLSHPKYDLLARHIQGEVNPNMRTQCSIGSSGRLLAIKIGNKIYKVCNNTFRTMKEHI